MEFIKDSTELPEFIRKLMKKGKFTGHNLAMLLGKDPAYLSRVINGKHEISADIMFKILKHMGHEVAIMTKKERNQLEKAAYAELYKKMSSFREEIREGIVNEIEHDLIKKINEYFSNRADHKVDKRKK